MTNTPLGPKFNIHGEKNNKGKGKHLPQEIH